MRRRVSKHPELHHLIEVIIDLGRKPLARFPSGDFVLSDHPITFQDLEHATSQVKLGLKKAVSDGKRETKRRRISATKPVSDPATHGVVALMDCYQRYAGISETPQSIPEANAILELQRWTVAGGKLGFGRNSCRVKDYDNGSGGNSHESSSECPNDNDNYYWFYHSEHLLPLLTWSKLPRAHFPSSWKSSDASLSINDCAHLEH
uniref:Uncharacterized protein n=1 Tax=Nelumbo nucifera TaxID=4432 RepID=A0A822YV70_NELNU|nr:TPA_asm: hypothetical protein HUJ06_005645 [Nelumbo nucifera]